MSDPGERDERAQLIAQARALSPAGTCHTGLYEMSAAELRSYIPQLQERAERQAAQREMGDR